VPSVSADKDFCVQFLVERDFSIPRNAQTGSGAHPASYSIGTGVLSRGSCGWGVKLTTHLPLAPSLKCGATPLLLPYAFMVLTAKTFFVRLYLRQQYASMFFHETLSAKLHGVTSQTIVILHSGVLVSRPRCEPATF
jgi:hypothetical protein